MDGQDLHHISNKVSVPAIGTVVQVGTVAGGIHVPEPGPGSSSYVPRQLPAPPVRFTGRETDLARLTQAVSQGPAGTVVISAVGGTGGIGKTWLVLQWAHRHLDRFPDGQLHVDLRGFSPDSTPMPTSVALRGFLCALGVPPAAIPVDEHVQAALFRSVAAGKRMLIVLDNAVDTEQIMSLLPGSPSCTVLVTSRRRLTGLICSYGAQHLALDVLPDKDARALLAARLGDARLAREPAAVNQLLAACGGFPLALSVVAGQAAAHPDLPLTAMVAELRDAGLAGLDDGDTAASVPAVLSWSYRALAPGNAHAFALLGIAPGPDISLAAAASLTGKSLGEARTVLRDLEQASLLIRHTGNRYSMHDLTRACARDHAEHDLATQDRKSALDRVIGFYVHTAHHAHLVLEPHDHHVALNRPVPGCRPQPLTTHAEALTWFALDHTCLLETQRTAQQDGPVWAVWQLAWALTAYHNLRGLLAENHRVWLEARRAADACADPVVDALVHRHLGNVCVRIGRIDEGREHLNRALSVAERIDDRTAQARIHRIISVMYEHHGDNRMALEHATRSLQLFRAVGDRIWEADTLSTVAWCTALLGRYNEARQHGHTAFPVLHQQHPPGEADTLDTIGYITYHCGHHTDALEYFRRALALYRDLGDVYHAADTLDRIGHVFFALRRTPEAHTAWHEALSLCRTQHRGTDAQRIKRKIDTLEPHLIARSWPYRRR